MTMGHRGGAPRRGRPPLVGAAGLPLDGSFTDRVMARVANEPTPSPGRVFARALGRLAMRDALAALLTAWRLGFEPTAPVARPARASAAGLFLSVVIALGLGGAFVASGALVLLTPDGPVPPQQAPAAVPVDSPAVITPAPLPTPLPPPSPAPAKASVDKAGTNDRAGRSKRATPQPKNRQKAKKVRRATPEPKERERPEREDRDEREKDD